MKHTFSWLKSQYQISKNVKNKLLFAQRNSNLFQKYLCQILDDTTVWGSLFHTAVRLLLTVYSRPISYYIH